MERVIEWSWGADGTRSHLMEVLATPLGGVLACVSVKDGEIALAPDCRKVDDKRVRVLHGATLATIVRNADLIAVWRARVLVQSL